MRSQRGFEYASLLQSDQRFADIVEQARARTEKDGREMGAHFIDKARIQELFSLAV